MNSTTRTTTFKITFDDGSSVTDSMPASFTIYHARARFIGKEFTDGFGGPTRKAVSVEQID